MQQAGEAAEQARLDAAAAKRQAKLDKGGGKKKKGALARMKKALERGRIPQTRYDREQEAITARLVSIYRALDRMAER